MEPEFPPAGPLVLHEGPGWLALSKPAGMHSVEQRGGAAASVEAWLRGVRPELAVLDECGLVHRLDLETSGCLVVAKDPATRARLREAFSGRGGDVRKTYLALVEGLARDGGFALSFTSRHKGSAKVTVRPHGEPESIGRCRWRVRPREAPTATDVRATLLEVELLGPGRRHQIRAGLASLGHPLVGDALYGARSDGTPRLHAWRVALDGISVEAPPPAWAQGTAPS